MLDTGIVRRVDALGRIVIPIELRKTLGIKVGDPLEIYSDKGYIVLKKHEEACTFCGQDEENMISLNGKLVCPSCKSKLANL